jgi:hypothetical protein
VQAPAGELFRVGVLGGMEWMMEFLSEKCQFVYAHSHQEFDKQGPMSQMPACTRKDKI